MVASVSLVAVAALGATASPATAATAPGGPGTASTWNEPLGTQGYATAISPTSKVWYMLANGALQNVYYPQTDNPDTYGMQFYVTDGSGFTDNEINSTTHSIALADPKSLTWTQTNTATSGKYTITKTYVADPARSVILVNTTFTNNSATPLSLYADYLPQLNNQGNGNTGSTDTATGDLVASNGPVASALAASVSFTAASTGYVGTVGSGSTQLASGHTLGATYTGTTSPGHIDQTAQIPVAASGSTSFTLALAFDSTTAAAVADASASLAAGFAATETAYQAGWHTWNAGLNSPPVSVTSSPGLLTQYEVSLMETKADEDKTYVGGFVASPSTPWGSSVSADSPGGHGYHLVWTRDEYQMASALLAVGDKQDANDALTYILTYEEGTTGQVKQNTWLNGNPMWGGNQQDEQAYPLILAYQLGRTGAADYARLKLLATFIAANGPTTGQERWEENGGYSPATIAAEIAGLVTASSLATANGDTANAASWLATAKTWASKVDSWTYTTNGSYGNGSYFLRVTPDGQPNSGATIGLANGGGTHDDRTVVDQSFLDLVRLGVIAPGSTEVTNTLAVDDAQIAVNTTAGQIDHRYGFDGYGENASGADYTGAGTGNPWPVLSGERGEYDVAVGNLTGAQSTLQTMADSASNYQISEQVWNGPTGTNGFTAGKPDNSATPLIWAMGQYVRLAVDISAGQNVDTPAVVCQTFNACSAPPTSAPVAPTALAATAVHTTGITLAWTGAPLAAGYKVYRATGTGAAALVATTANTTYSDTGLTASTSYTYYVTAYNNIGTSPNSATVSATTKAPSPPPDAPSVLNSAGATSTTVALTWQPATDTAGGTVAGYNVYRATGTGTPALVGTTAATGYNDTGLSPTTAYTYYVTAFDTDGNESAHSNSITALTTANNVEVVNVTVPAYTDQTGLKVYLDGTLSALGGGQPDWAASGIAFTRVDATHWTTTVTAAGPTTLQYKYTIGAAWANNEETSSCGYVGNRTLVINGGTTTDTVANWAGPYSCGNPPTPTPTPTTTSTPTPTPTPTSTATSETVHVTVPSSTPTDAKVYLAGNLSVLGEGQADWAAGGILMTRLDATHFTATLVAAKPSTLAYKYTVNANWANNEETSGCAYVGNRSMSVNGGTVNDTVANWKGYGGC